MKTLITVILAEIIGNEDGLIEKAKKIGELTHQVYMDERCIELRSRERGINVIELHEICESYANG